MSKKKIFIVRENIKNARHQITEHLSEYISFLKVIGSNYRFPVELQENIYYQKNDAKACLSYEDWKKKYHRVPMRKQKGIGIVIQRKRKEWVNYVFDVTQTVPLKNAKEIVVWKYDKERHQNLLNVLVEQSGGNENIEEWSAFDQVAFNYASRKIIQKMNDENIPTENRAEFFNFVVESVKIVMDSRLNIGYQYDEENLQYYQWFKDNLNLYKIVSETVSDISKEAIRDIIKLGTIIDLKYDKEKVNHENRNNWERELQSRDTSRRGILHSNESKGWGREEWASLSGGSDRRDRWGEDRDFSTNSDQRGGTGGNGGGRSWITEQVGQRECTIWRRIIAAFGWNYGYTICE